MVAPITSAIYRLSAYNVMPSKVKVSDWDRGHYYPLLRQYFVDKFAQHGQLSHRFEDGIFLPVISPAAGANKAYAEDKNRSIMAQMKQEYIQKFDECLKSRFAFVVGSL